MSEIRFVSKETKNLGTMKIGRGHLVRYIRDDNLVRRQSRRVDLFSKCIKIFLVWILGKKILQNREHFLWTVFKGVDF